jgi:hypothetical protein
MARIGDFPFHVKYEAFKRQGGVCAFCGIKLIPPLGMPPPGKGPYLEKAEAHHFIPLLHGGIAKLDNCVYLCEAHHKYIGHGMATLGIDKQGGSSKTYVKLPKKHLPYWNGKK